MSTYSLARSEFDRTCHLVSPDLPGNFWGDLQMQLSRWVNYAYGYQPSERMVLGLMEEYDEYREATDVAKISDALGDMSIFLIQLVNNHRLESDVLIKFGAIDNADMTPDRWIGRLAHVELKYLQGIRGMVEKNTGLEDRHAVRSSVATLAASLFRWLETTTDKLELAHPAFFKGPLKGRTRYEELVLLTAKDVMRRKKNLLPRVMGEPGPTPPHI